MDDIASAIGQAFARLLPRLRADPAELRARLDRCNRSLLNRPPRAWCVAIRASDTRLPPYVTRTALDVARTAPDRAAAHVVALDARAIAKLITPVRIEPPGVPLHELAAMLGLAPSNLRGPRLRGLFQTHHIAGLAGRRGRPVPVLYTDQPLDPQSRSLASGDALWSLTSRHAAGRLRRALGAMRTLPVTLTRVPMHAPIGPREGTPDPALLHPEHPLNDPPMSKSRGRLPPPAPDPVPYKWRDGAYLGYDASVPGASARYQSIQTKRDRANARRRDKRKQHPPPSRAGGSLPFRGWRWVCPTCGKKVAMLYLPLPRLALLPQGVHKWLRQSDAAMPPGGAVAWSCPGFACSACHRVKHLSLADAGGWNELVCYLTAGLLYGHEVERPAWCTPQRKNVYAPRPMRAPSVRRPQIERLLLSDLSMQQIAEIVGVTKGTVLWTAQQVYRQAGVRTRVELLTQRGHRAHAARLRGAHSPRIRELLLAGQPIPAIAATLGVKRMAVYNMKQRMRKEGVKFKDGRVTNRLGKRLTQSSALSTQHSVLKLAR